MSSDGAPAERRRPRSKTGEMSVSVQPYQGGDARWVGWVLGLTRRDIRLELERRFEKKTLLLIRADHPSRDEDLSFLGLVTDVSLLPNEKWEISCTLLRELSIEMVQDILI